MQRGGGVAVGAIASRAAAGGSEATEMLDTETTLPVCSTSNTEPSAVFAARSSRSCPSRRVAFSNASSIAPCTSRLNALERIVAS
ncbi:hypothetical protein PR003_g12945 [Phytophthora rubi]|uniref:Uncharacterized protein n=1 Tax=Phytophthora rubi TaxID=129364 RepID=A0A6A4FIV6_9STRA|nr:hypothetical protein PR001_g12208 [Phytophthora rubi]KAE9335564.1 hypothetical protein PR003_g12945 [Phytophthora rubi]